MNNVIIPQKNDIVCTKTSFAQNTVLLEIPLDKRISHEPASRSRRNDVFANPDDATNAKKTI
jgi:hypothetical protein